MAITEALSQFLATTHALMEGRKSEGRNTDHFPGDGHEKVLDVCCTGVCALTRRTGVFPRSWRSSDDVALLGPWLGDRHEKDSRNSGPGLPIDHWRGTNDIICVWSSATTLNGHLLHRQGRHSATHSRSPLPFS
jgi:hypothetical protein